MEQVGYTFPKANTVNEEADLFYHAAKLSEETGEVCQAICKRKAPAEIVEECIDVIWSAECILRYLGITDGIVANMRRHKIRENIKRGYVNDDGEMRLFDEPVRS